MIAINNGTYRIPLFLSYDMIILPLLGHKLIHLSTVTNNNH